MNMSQPALLAAFIALLILAWGPADARKMRGLSPVQYMTDHRIKTACLKISVPAKGLATVVESSGDPELDKVVLVRANSGREATAADTSDASAATVLPFTFNLSEVISGGRDVCPRARPE